MRSVAAAHALVATPPFDHRNEYFAVAAPEVPGFAGGVRSVYVIGTVGSVLRQNCCPGLVVGAFADQVGRFATLGCGEEHRRLKPDVAFAAAAVAVAASHLN